MSARKPTKGGRRSIVPLNPLSTSMSANGIENGMIVTTPLASVALPINDDEAERLARKRNRVMELQHDRRLSSFTGGDSTHSHTNLLSGFTSAQLAEHYEDCIKLNAENKITVKNAFGLHLIDYMAEMLKKKDSEMNNFQVASCTLDASTKIYAYRVDCIHAETQKMACGLSRSSTGSKDKRSRSDDDGSGGDRDGEDDDRENRERPKKKKKQAKKGKTIEQNVKALNANKFDLQIEVDPLFRKTTELFADGGASGGVLLSNLCCRNDGCELVLDSMDPIKNIHPSVEEQIKSQQETEFVDVKGFVEIFRKIASETTKICPPFADFEFGSWKPGDTLGANWEFGEDNRGDSQRENDSPDDNDFNGGFVDGGIASDEERNTLINPPSIHQTTRETPEIINNVDLTQMLATEPGEYSYFNKEFESAWAGPNHWHIKPLSKGITLSTKDRERKPKTRKPAVKLDYDVDPDEFECYFIKSKNSVTLCKTTVKQWTSDSFTLPEDIHYEAKTLYQLFVKPSVVISRKHPSVQNADADIEIYDYNNANDVENYCPAIADDAPGHSFSGSDNAPSPATSRFFPESNVGFDTQIESQDATMRQTILAFTGDNLIQQPWKVAKFDIPFARTAKRINVRRLKENIWNILDKNGQKRVTKVPAADTLSTQPDATHSFRDVYRRLPTVLSSEMTQNLTVSIAFACVLHLANEKNLHISPQSDMKDFSIELEAENPSLD